MLDNCQHIRHRLTRMFPIRQTIDDRHARILRQFSDVRMRKDPRHDTIDISRQDARDIRNAFALSQPDFIRGEIQRLSAQMQHRHIE